MPRDDIARRQHNRDHLRYPSDLTDREWSIIEPFITPAKSGGRPRTTDMREVVNAILYIGDSGCQWRALPGDFPPTSTVRGSFHDWRNAGLWQTMNRVLVASTREPVRSGSVSERRRDRQPEREDHRKRRGFGL